MRRVDQELAGDSYLVHHVGADRLEWGLVGEWRGDRKVNVSSRERTAADMLSDPALGGGIRHTMEVLDSLLSVAKLEDLVGALAHHVVEKDYVLGWLLAGVAQHPQTRSWAFKGGTCLRKWRLTAGVHLRQKGNTPGACHEGISDTGELVSRIRSIIVGVVG